MPESAEVKLTAEYLNSVLENKVINEWVFTSGQYKDTKPPGFEKFEEALPLLVSHVACKGKLIYMQCFNEYETFYIVHSMRLTGSWRETEDSCTRWYIELDDGKKVYFHDSRCLATLYFTTVEEELQDALNKLGPDILSPDFNLDCWQSLVRRHSNKNITAFLMDQHIMSGCGNYIKAEALYEAKISPLRKVGSLTDNELRRLYEALITIPRTAYAYKGLSLRDYTDPKGRKGTYEFVLKVYGNKKATRLKTPDGRTTYYFPDEQK